MGELTKTAVRESPLVSVSLSNKVDEPLAVKVTVAASSTLMESDTVLGAKPMVRVAVLVVSETPPQLLL